jgi:hypothetical protein
VKPSPGIVGYSSWILTARAILRRTDRGMRMVSSSESRLWSTSPSRPEDITGEDGFGRDEDSTPIPAAERLPIADQRFQAPGLFEQNCSALEVHGDSESIGAVRRAQFARPRDGLHCCRVAYRRLITSSAE